MADATTGGENKEKCDVLETSKPEDKLTNSKPTINKTITANESVKVPKSEPASASVKQAVSHQGVVTVPPKTHNVRVNPRRKEYQRPLPVKRAPLPAGIREGGIQRTKRHRSDKEYMPTIDMMVHDFDDERTIAEEETYGTVEDPQVELSSLQKEGDMPLEDLMAMYGYGEDMNGGSGKSERLYQESREDSEVNVRPSRYVARQQSDEDYEDEEEEDEGSPEEKKKTIMIGSDYQAKVPVGLCKYDDALPYENEDKLVWDPSSLAPKEIDDYLKKAQEPLMEQGMMAIPRGAHIRDDEQALYTLLQCGYNTEEALRRLRLHPAPPSESMSLWSEEECRNYELGLRSFGKDFRRIHQHKVKTRSVAELVQFYYLWKKTERHDVFANSARLEKKKYSLHPGITDYMDRFLDEQDGNNSRERSTSPSQQAPALSETSLQPVKIEKEEKEPTEDSGEKKFTPSDKILLNPK